MMFIVFGMLCCLLVLVVCLKAREAEYKPSYHSFTPDGEDDAYSVDDEDRSSVADVSLKSLEKHVQLEMTAIPITRYLSPSLYMLLLLKVAQSFYAQVYCIAYPVVFAQDFGISPSVGGISLRCYHILHLGWGVEHVICALLPKVDCILISSSRHGIHVRITWHGDDLSIVPLPVTGIPASHRDRGSHSGDDVSISSLHGASLLFDLRPLSFFGNDRVGIHCCCGHLVCLCVSATSTEPELFRNENQRKSRIFGQRACILCHGSSVIISA